ncbi:unnamed protein product, partial [marine sediment metagenome]
MPSKEQSNTSLISDLKDSIRTDVGGTLANVFNATRGGFKVFEKGLTKVDSSLEAVLNSANSVLNVTNEFGNLQNTIFNMQDNLASIIKTPTELAARYKVIFDNFELVAQRNKDLFDMSRRLFGFGDDDTDTKTETFIQRQTKA